MVCQARGSRLAKDQLTMKQWHGPTFEPQIRSSALTLELLTRKLSTYSLAAEAKASYVIGCTEYLTFILFLPSHPSQSLSHQNA